MTLKTAESNRVRCHPFVSPHPPPSPSQAFSPVGAALDAYTCFERHCLILFDFWHYHASIPLPRLSFCN
ncbi:hypothetical protein AFLA_003380 [Aspergillus flavus NRRL3357]|nr:hypothetical protein AFLA_003380 [Aspergillus flavus NRRL3357]